jgi:predicted acetyltransferase
MKENRALTENCQFKTDRLRVDSWQHYASTINDNTLLYQSVVSILIPEVTKALPPGWQDIDTTEKANDWIENSLVGFLILNGEPASNPDLIDVHLGYLLSRQTWGKGIGSELIKGLVSWCEATENISSISGGVEVDNIASIRVLEKNGFTPTSSTPSAEGMTFLKKHF